MGYKTEKKIPSIILSVFIVLLILVGTIVPAYAAPTQDMMVTDSGEMLSDREEQEVSEMLYSINRQTGIEYLVYTIKSLNGEDIETCANRLFRTAGLGVDILPTAKAGGFLHQPPLRSNRSCCVLHDVRQALLPVCPTVRYVLV